MTHTTQHASKTPTTTAHSTTRDLDAEAMDWLDTLDPATTPAHVVPLEVRAVAEAADAVDAAETALDRAIVRARWAGASWTDLARPLGVSRQAMRQKYAKLEQDAREHPEAYAVVVDFRDVDERDRHDIRS